MKHTLLYICIAATALAACKGSDAPREDLAAKAAQSYYSQLAKGDYEAFAKGIADGDSLPPAYRSQLIDAAKQLMATQRDEHGGIDSVAIVDSRTDSITRQTVALLTLCFADSLKEEVAVPMVERDGEWKMK